jgi:hypothetical protein
MWEPRRLTTLWAFTACYRDSLTFQILLLDLLFYYYLLRDAYCCVLVLYMSLFSCQTQYAKQFARVSLCITELIGRTISQHVSALGAVIRRYMNKHYTIESCLLYGSMYCIYHCVLTINRKIWRASFPFVNHVYMHRLSGCGFILL